MVFTRVHTSKQLQSHKHRLYQDLSDSDQENNKQQQNLNPTRSQMEICQHDPSAPTIKGLIKIHKPNLPIRRVVNWRNAPAYKLVKLFTQKIRQMAPLPNTHNVDNTRELINKLKNTPILPPVETCLPRHHRLIHKYPSCGYPRYFIQQVRAKLNRLPDETGADKVVLYCHQSKLFHTHWKHPDPERRPRNGRTIFRPNI